MIDKINEIDDIDDIEDIEEDEWEVLDFSTVIAEKYPGWHLVKIINFNKDILRDIDEWLQENMKHSYKREGWDSGCSYSVGVVFESGCEAMLFKLRWR